MGHRIERDAPVSMWSAHIGLGFATYLTNGSLLALGAISLGSGDPAYGAVLIASYWLGRATPVWVAPLLWTGRDAGSLMCAMVGIRLTCQKAAGLALLFLALMQLWISRAGWHFI
jgi:hypothetical protein